MASVQQELTDRLVIAVDEQDVLFVLYWINELKKQQCLAQGIHGKHSWKRYCALTSIARNPPSPFRKLILQLLLLSGLEVKTLDIIHLELVREYSDMVSQVMIDMLKKWGWEEREKAVYARLLLSIPLEQAAHWIDAILPPHPDPATLTGYSSLPPPPLEPYLPATILDHGRLSYYVPLSEAQRLLPLTYPILSKVLTYSPPLATPESLSRPQSYHASSKRWAHAADSHPPHYIPTQRSPHTSRESANPHFLEPPPTEPVPVPQLTNPVSLAFARFPQGFTARDLIDLFPSSNRPSLRVARLESKTNETWVIIRVEYEEAEGWIRCLDGIEFGGKRKMRCFVTEMTGEEIMEDETKAATSLQKVIDHHIASAPRSTSRPSTLKSTSTPVKKSRSSTSIAFRPKSLHRPPPVPTTVLIFNLPLTVNVKHLQRFGITDEKYRFQRYSNRNTVVAVVHFGSKRSAGMFCHRYRERQEEKKGRMAVMVGSDKSVEEHIREHFEAMDLENSAAKPGSDELIGLITVATRSVGCVCIDFKRRRIGD